ELAATPGLAQTLSDAGINTIETGGYSNPADNHQPDFASWRQGWDDYWNGGTEAAAATGFSLITPRGGVTRSPEELQDTLTNPWAPDAIRYSQESLAGHSICMEAYDEIGGLPIPEFDRKVMEIIHSASRRPAISWPVVAGATTEEVQAWMGD